MLLLKNIMGLLRPAMVFGLLEASREALAAVLAASALCIPWLYQDSSSSIPGCLLNHSGCASRELVSVL
jgi:hypothetical protein